VYPNPADDFVHIDLRALDPNGGKMQLFDNSGREVWNAELRSEICRIDTSSYPAGLYFLVLRDQSYYSSQKLLIK
jgi:hypothetical protein